MGQTNKNAFTLMKKRNNVCYFPNDNSNRNDNGDKNVIS